MNLQTTEITHGVKLHYLHTKKFKTLNLTFFIHRRLTQDEVTKNALLSLVMRRGCPEYRTSMELSNALNELYGASADTGIKKKGGDQIITVSFSFANERFVPGNPPVFADILRIAKSMIVGQDCFDNEYVAQEKENLKALILSQKNDKRQYAQARCIEEMCRDEAYGIPRYGYVDRVDEITAAELLRHYRDEVLTSVTDIFLCGDADIESASATLKQMYENVTVGDAGYPECNSDSSVLKVKKITETEPIAQGKLCIGFRTGITSRDSDYPALMMYNAILGNGIFSKLFNNVREKMSLCYYASSSMDYIKGLMFINSGIEVADYEKAYNAIIAQVDDMKNGVISEQELTAARLGTVNNIKSVTDSAFGTADYYLGKMINGKMITTQQLTELINAVTQEQIVNAAAKIQLDTVYFLKGSETGEES